MLTNATTSSKPKREAGKRMYTGSGALDPTIRVKHGGIVNKLWIVGCCDTAQLHLSLQNRTIWLSLLKQESPVIIKTHGG